jgi:poly-gamma-glutamate capsule biosynthesis protein CapA/YwtB (metallophosphatase superfamily)
VKLRLPVAVAAAVGAISLAACSSAAHPTAQFAAQSPAAGKTSARATASAHPTASSSAKGSATGSAAGPVTIAAVGDMLLGNTPDLPPDPATYLDPVKQELDSGAQVVFGNLEGTLTTADGGKCAGAAAGTCYAFRDPPDFVNYYKGAGFTVLNDANNHSMDFGPAGQAQTVQTIHAAGLAQTGLPGEITLVKANGVRVAFLAFAPYNYTASLLNLPAAHALIQQAAKEASVVVVYMHVGAEGSDADHVTGQEEDYLGEDRGNPEAFAHAAIDAGASLVIASGPHVLRGMQFYRGHLIAYSLGNFAGYGNFGTDGDLALSAILHVTLSGTGQFEQARLYPVEDVGKGQPVPGGGTVSFVSQLSQQDFGSSAAHFSSTGVIQAP